MGPIYMYTLEFPMLEKLYKPRIRHHPMEFHKFHPYESENG